MNNVVIEGETCVIIFAIIVEESPLWDYFRNSQFTRYHHLINGGCENTIYLLMC